MDTTCDLTVLVPSRGRPEAARDLIESFVATVTARTDLVFVVDIDDPTMSEYLELSGEFLKSQKVRIELVKNTPHTMVYALNYAARIAANLSEASSFAIGFMGDDHRPRTVGWDERYLVTLRELGTGFVYGNDTIQGENIPTQCAMTTNIVHTLNRMAPEGLRHLYVDNYWRDLGQAAQCIRYLPDVVIEHCHPCAGKAEWDEGHIRVNAPEVWSHDTDAYEHYLLTAFDTDVKTLWRLRGGTV